MTDDEVLRGALYDELVGAMQKVPELAGRQLTLTALSGGITNRNFRVDAAGTDDRWVIRLAGNDTHLLGISREVEHAATVAAAGVGVGPEVTAFIRPEGYLVTRFIVGSPVSDAAVHEPDTLRRVADSLRRIHDGPAIPGLFIPLRIVEAYRALALARGVPIPPEYELASAVGRRIELALLADPIELRPCHNDLLNANFIDDGTRIRIIDWEYAGMGDPFFDLGNFSINHELTPDEDEILLTAYDGAIRPGAAGAIDADARRLRLPRGHVGRPPAGREHARRRLRRVRSDELRPPPGQRRAAALRARPGRGRHRLNRRFARSDTLSPMTDEQPPRTRRSVLGTTSLGLVAFAATLILLFGLASLVRQGGGSSAGPSVVPTASSAPSFAVTSPSPVAASSTPSSGPSGAIASGSASPSLRRHRRRPRATRSSSGRATSPTAICPMTARPRR